MILADGNRESIRSEVERLRPTIGQHFEIVAQSFDFSDELPQADADLAIVFGGDGSILRAAHQMAYHQRPVLGVNLGRLGFLAAIQPEQLDALLPEVAAGQHTIVSHLMFECTVTRDSKPVAEALGLNEVAVLAGPPFAILDVQLYVDGELVTTYSCDGLIVSTPIGSTAHNLSAGGPILRKDLQAFVISPISPHTLTNRPVVDAADRVYELVVPHPHEGTSLVVDGRVLCQISGEDRIRIERSKAQFDLIEIRGQGYYQTLREKLGWGGQLNLGE